MEEKNKTQFAQSEKISLLLLGSGFILGFLGVFRYQYRCDKYVFLTALFANLMQLIYIRTIFRTNKIKLQDKFINIANLVVSIFLFLYGLVLFLLCFNAKQVEGMDCGYGLMMGLPIIGVIPFLVFCVGGTLNTNHWKKRLK